MYFPAEFTPKMREQVLWDYVDREDANLNYLQLLEYSQSSPELPISDKLKLQARRRKETLQEKLFAGGPGFSYGGEVTFKSIPDGSVEEVYREKDHVYSYAYSKEWLQENLDYPTLLNNFIYLFNMWISAFDVPLSPNKRNSVHWSLSWASMGNKIIQWGLTLERRKCVPLSRWWPTAENFNS